MCYKNTSMAAETELFPRRFPDNDAAEINYLKWQYWETVFNIDHLQYVQNNQLQWRGTVNRVQRRHPQEVLDNNTKMQEKDEREKLRRIENSLKYFGVRPPIDDHSEFHNNELPPAAGPSAAASGRVLNGSQKPNPESVPQLRPWDYFAEGPLQGNVALNPYLICFD